MFHIILLREVYDESGFSLIVFLRQFFLNLGDRPSIKNTCRNMSSTSETIEHIAPFGYMNDLHSTIKLTADGNTVGSEHCINQEGPFHDRVNDPRKHQEKHIKDPVNVVSRHKLESRRNDESATSSLGVTTLECELGIDRLQEEFSLVNVLDSALIRESAAEIGIDTKDVHIVDNISVICEVCRFACHCYKSTLRSLSCHCTQHRSPRSFENGMHDGFVDRALARLGYEIKVPNIIVRQFIGTVEFSISSSKNCLIKEAIPHIDKIQSVFDAINHCYCIDEELIEHKLYRDNEIHDLRTIVRSVFSAWRCEPFKFLMSPNIVNLIEKHTERLLYDFLCMDIFDDNACDEGIDCEETLKNIMTDPLFVEVYRDVFTSMLGPLLVQEFNEYFARCCNLLVYVSSDMFLKYYHEQLIKLFCSTRDHVFSCANMEPPMLIVEDFELSSSLNGSHGEYTGTDDLPAKVVDKKHSKGISKGNVGGASRATNRPPTSSKSSSSLCFSFSKDGTCQWGENCRFSHGAEGGGVSHPKTNKKSYVECEMVACKQPVHYHRSQSKVERSSKVSAPAERRLMAKQGKVDLCKETGEVKYYRCNNDVEDCGSHYHYIDKPQEPLVNSSAISELQNDVVEDDVICVDTPVERLSNVESLGQNAIRDSLEIENVELPPMGVQARETRIVLQVPETHTTPEIREDGQGLTEDERQMWVEHGDPWASPDDVAESPTTDSISDVSFIQDSMIDDDDVGEQALVLYDNQAIPDLPLNNHQIVLQDPNFRTELQKIFYCSTQFGDKSNFTRNEWSDFWRRINTTPGLMLMDFMGVLSDRDNTSESMDFSTSRSHEKRLIIFGVPVAEITEESFIKFSTAVGYDRYKEGYVYPVVLEWLRNGSILKQIINPDSITVTHTYVATMNKIVVTNLIENYGADAKITVFDDNTLRNTYAYFKNCAVYGAFVNKASNPRGANPIFNNASLYF